MNILDLGPAEFLAALDELGIAGDQRDALVAQYSDPSRGYERDERPFLTRLADNVIGFDDGVETQGERIGQSARMFFDALREDPLGTAGGMISDLYGQMERGVQGDLTPYETFELAGILSLPTAGARFDPNVARMFGGRGTRNDTPLPPPENAQRTQISGTLPTYIRADELLNELRPEGQTLDFGAGLGLSQKELGYDTFEPYPREGFEPTFRSASDIPSSSYDRITNFNVLNVVPRNVRDSIVSDIGRILAPEGVALITTRGRDVLSAGGTPGPEPMSVITSRNTYQKGFTPAELQEYVQNVLGPGYEVSRTRLGPAGVQVRRIAAPSPRDFGFYRDNPGGEWLRGKQERADIAMAESGRGLGRRGITGSVTGTMGMQTDLFMPTRLLSTLTGLMDERRVPGDPKFDALLARAREEGFDPNQAGNRIVIAVNHRGDPYVLEGNTRIAVARELGIPNVKAEVRYWNGGEDAEGPFAPQNVAQIATSAPEY